MSVSGEINKAVTLTAAFGAGYDSLGTVGYTLYNGDGTTFQARTTTGVAAALGVGNYRVKIASSVFTAAFTGYVVWDTGGSTPIYTEPEDIFISDRIDAAVSAVKAKTDLIPAAGPADAAHFTNARGDLLANLDAAVSGRADGSVWTSALAAVLSSLSTRTGTAQAGAAGSITLDAGASGVNDFYVGQWVVIASGAGAGQSRLITSYVGSTKVATVHTNWKTNPSNTSVFYLLAAADIQGVVLADTATALTNAPPDSPGDTTLLTRIPQALGFSANGWVKVDVEDWKNTAAPAMTGDAYARLGAPAGASVSADVAAVKSDTAAVKTDVESSGVVVAAGSKTGYALTAAYDPAKTAAQAGDAMALTSGERTALTAVIWNALTSGMSTVGSIGKLLATNIDALISSRLATSGYTAPDNTDIAAIKTELDALRVDYTTARATRIDHLDADISTRLATSSYVAPDNSDIATILTDVVTLLGNASTLLSRLPSDVWDEAAAGHTTAGTFGKLMAFLDASVASRLATSGYTAPDNSDIVTTLADVTALIGSVNTLLARIPGDILDEVVTGHNTANSVGKLLQLLDAAISSRSTYAGADTAGTTTLLGLLTPTRAAYLDNLVRLDAAITTRLATAGYTAPDNADVVTILADVAILLTRLPADVWDELLASHTVTGSAGKALGSAIDPWATPLPGAYTATQAGALFAAIKAKTDLLGTAQIALTSPVTKTGKMLLVAGDDYKAADGRAIQFTIDSSWPSLAGATVALKIGSAINVAGTISSTKISFDLTHTQTASLGVGTRRYTVVATLSDGSTVTLADGPCSTISA